MAERDIIQNMISMLGQSQDDRLPPELSPLSRTFVDIDERTAANLLSQAQALAKKLRFYRDQPDKSAGDWSEYFQQCDEKLLLRNDGQVPPHLALFAAFVGLYRYPQQALNDIARRHMEFQFRDVLRFEPKPAKPDSAHLLLELKKNTSPIAVTPAFEFSAGKDGNGIELLYRPVRETVIGHGKIETLHSTFHNADGIFFAPVANSADGLGGEFKDALPQWSAFGGSLLPKAQVGCAISSPVLRMQEGTRKIRAVLTLAGIDGNKHKEKELGESFEAYVTGPKGWLGPLTQISVSLSKDELTLEFSLSAETPAVVDYAQAIHGHAFAAQAPVLQLLLKKDAPLSYDALQSLTVRSVQIFVTVRDLQNLVLENDEGSLNPKKAFLPFGAQPVIGSRFMIGCEEALSKQLSDIRIHLTWLNAPEDLSKWYAGYTKADTVKNGIDAVLAYQDHRGTNIHVEQPILDCSNTGTSTLGSKVGKATPQKLAPNLKLFALMSAGNRFGRLSVNKFRMENPIHQNTTVPQVSARSGYITIMLTEGFLHVDYRTETVSNIINKVRDSKDTTKLLVLNEPYTPKVQSIRMDYDAYSEKADIASNLSEDFAAQALQFFHVGCFGQRREHGFLRAHIKSSPGVSIPLLPEYPDEGEFLIGLSGVNAGDSLSLLIQVAEDSAEDSTLEAAPVMWSVLNDNYWHPLTLQDLSLDTCNNLRRSGIIATSLPHETSSEHTWMPAGRVWLRASIRKNSAAANRLRAVAANAVEVRFAGTGHKTIGQAPGLAPNSISKLKTPRPEVKSVAQPYAGFGGQLQESNDLLARRAAERLRHRNRCISPWDYERMLLEAFPDVHKVKCIPHASENSWLAPGHVMLVAIPNLRNLDAAHMMEPRIDIDALNRMEACLQQQAGMFAQAQDNAPLRIKVKNPLYRRIRLDFKVRFRPGLAFNHYYHELQRDLLRALAPWTYDKKRDIEFGGRLYRSALLNFVEELTYVDFVTDFKMGVELDAKTAPDDLAEIAADRPDIVFTSSRRHQITEYTDL